MVVTYSSGTVLIVLGITSVRLLVQRVLGAFKVNRVFKVHKAYPAMTELKAFRVFKVSRGLMVLMA